MKFFFRRKDDPYPQQQGKEHHIALTERDFFWLDENDAPLKFRLPEEQERMINEICSFLDISASDFIRQVLFMHLYGRYDLLGLLERQLPSLNEGRDVCPSAQPEPPLANVPSPPHPKNVADFKVWLPRAMKDDLALLANDEKMTLSRYVRTVVVTHLTGHPALAQRSPLNRPFIPVPQSSKRKK